MFRRILIANRGEIAVRVIRACRELGIAAAAVHSEADARALHVRLADSAVCIGSAAARESYLDSERVLAAAREMECDAVHPGYGFLSENASFAEAVQTAGMAWIGPPPAAIRAMGLKIEARRLAAAAGVPVVPGWEVGVDGVHPSSKKEGQPPAAPAYPLLVKASAGGGGKGMRIVERAEDLPAAVSAAQREALGAFGDGSVYLEKYLVRPRHIEIQVLADAHGNCVHLGERECSIQRRHQKVLEESPSPFVSPELRAEMGACAVALAQAVQYVGAGTIEFIVAENGEYYFLEMNTRLQVEHPVTEFVYGLDLVQWQIRIAAGESLKGADGVRPLEGVMHRGQSPATPRGHAIEVRICAEDPAAGFLPQTGRVQVYREPQGPGVRVDSGIYEGWEVGPDYDPLLAKLIVFGQDRQSALARLRSALADYRILGVTTNLDFLRDLAAQPALAAGVTHTGFIATYMSNCQPPIPSVPVQLAVALAIATERVTRAASGGKDLDPSPWQSYGSWSNVAAEVSRG